MVDRIRHPGYPPRDRNLGPALARTHPWFAMRRPIDIALSEPPRRIDVELRQPERR